MSLAGPWGGGASCPQATYRALTRGSRIVVEASSHVAAVAIGSVF